MGGALAWVMGNWRSVVAIAVGAVLSFFLSPALSTALGHTGIHSWVVNGLTSGIMGAATGAVNAAITGTDVLQGALMGLFQGGVSGGILHGLGEIAGMTRNFLDNLIHIAGHGALGGAVNVMMGEKFGDGFLSGAFGAFSSYIPGGNGSFWTRTLKASILGGTGSVLGGGKFANGAYTAAFQHLFNEESPRQKRILFLGYDQTEQKLSKEYKKYFAEGFDIDYWDSQYAALIKAALDAGFTVVPKAQGHQIYDAWKSGLYSVIIYHTHGGKSGHLLFEVNGDYQSRMLPEVFKLNKGMGSDTLIIACCHYDKAVKPYIDRYNKFGTNLSFVQSPLINGGKTLRIDNRDGILNLIKSYRTNANAP